MIHGDVLGERARLSPKKTALLCIPSGMRLTYAKLNDRAIRCARFWIEQCALAKGDRVGILAKNRVEFLDAFFAAGKTGIILVPLNTRLTPAELGVILKDSGMRALLYDGEFADAIQVLKRQHSLSHWIALDNPCDPSDSSYADCLTQISSPASEWLAPHCGPEDVYCLLYTSGTTGVPKGVMIPHRMVAWNGYNTATCWQLSENDVSPVFTPLYHSGGLSAFLVPVFVAGGTIVLHREFDAAEVWRTIVREKCTVVLGVPTIFKMLAESPQFANPHPQFDLSQVRWFISGGAPLPIELIATYRNRGIVLKQGYGLTEVGVNCFSMSTEESVRKAGSIGKPMMFTEARLLVSPVEEAPPGAVGELCLRGPHVCLGYWNNPAATAASLDSDGWFHTGDLARRDDDGFYYIAGRSKDMFISGGVNVYPAEVEAELLKHPQVRDAAVIGVPDPTWGEIGVAFFSSAETIPPTAEEMTAFLAERLAKYKIPRRFILVQDLPRTAYGKVVKAELRQLFSGNL